MCLQVIVLNNVSLVVGEFVPCGPNQVGKGTLCLRLIGPCTQIIALNDKLGVTDRVQGGFFTALAGRSRCCCSWMRCGVSDDDSAGTKFEVPPGLTKIEVLHTPPAQSS